VIWEKTTRESSYVVLLRETFEGGETSPRIFTNGTNCTNRGWYYSQESYFIVFLKRRLREGNIFLKGFFGRKLPQNDKGSQAGKAV